MSQLERGRTGIEWQGDIVDVFLGEVREHYPAAFYQGAAGGPLGTLTRLADARIEYVEAVGMVASESCLAFSAAASR